jgi:hypothetical protein
VLGMAHKSTIDDAIGSLQSLAIAGRTSHASDDLEAALGRLVGSIALIEAMIKEQEPKERVVQVRRAVVAPAVPVEDESMVEDSVVEQPPVPPQARQREPKKPKLTLSLFTPAKTAWGIVVLYDPDKVEKRGVQATLTTVPFRGTPAWPSSRVPLFQLRLRIYK